MYLNPGQVGIDQVACTCVSWKNSFKPLESWLPGNRPISNTALVNLKKIGLGPRLNHKLVMCSPQQFHGPYPPFQQLNKLQLLLGLLVMLGQRELSRCKEAPVRLHIRLLHPRPAWTGRDNRRSCKENNEGKEGMVECHGRFSTNQRRLCREERRGGASIYRGN